MRDGYPQVDFGAGACTFCAECVRVCTPAALRPDEGAAPWSIKASVNEKCLAERGVECRICGEHCDAEAIRFPPPSQRTALPVIDTATCTGCGAVCRLPESGHCVDLTRAGAAGTAIRRFLSFAILISSPILLHLHALFLLFLASVMSYEVISTHHYRFAPPKQETRIDSPSLAKSLPAGLARGRRWDHLELLERIDSTGSISTAAGAMGMSYKAAWQAVEAMNNLSDRPVVERQAGGRRGGGYARTYGRRVVGAYRRLEKWNASGCWPPWVRSWMTSSSTTKSSGDST